MSVVAAPDALVAWLDGVNPDLANELRTDDPDAIVGAWDRLRRWLVDSAISMPGAVASNLIAAAILR